MVVNTHRTLSPDLFSHGMVPSVLEVSLHSSKTAGRHVLWTWELGHGDKSSIFPLGKLQKPARKTHWWIFLFIIQPWPSMLVLLMKQAACQFLLESHLSLEIHNLRVTTGTAVNTNYSPNTSRLWRETSITLNMEVIRPLWQKMKRK